ncbi:TPA: ATP-binding protein [Candidatus Poribacteria bacterium]|nr:ATP-binding protein [Candidatus Poribacteria bacterium]
MHENEEPCEIHIQVTEDIPPILFDRDTIAEVLWNLLHNAVKYSHPPKRVSVKLERDGDTVTLAVVDNGIGIPKREQKRIFERFYRMDDTLTREVQGSGLGLADD